MLFKKKKRKPLEDKKPPEFIDLSEYKGKLFNDLGLRNQKEGKTDKAIRKLSLAIKFQPSNAQYLINRASLYWYNKEADLAFKDLQKAVDLGSDKAKKQLDEYLDIYNNKSSKQKDEEKLLNDRGIRFLYHMTHRDNLPNILNKGILSHNKAYKNHLNRQDISNHDVNSRRAKVHDYVPFYFNPKNPMLFKRREMQSDLIFICAKRDLILQKNAMFTDGNAASNPTKFYTSLKDLDKINWDVLKAEFWNDFVDGKRIRCAEVLVPHMVAVNKIEEIICHNQMTKEFVKRKIGNLPINVTIKPNYYFSN